VLTAQCDAEKSADNNADEVSDKILSILNKYH
jgi:hypothetical protein